MSRLNQRLGLCALWLCSSAGLAAPADELQQAINHYRSSLPACAGASGALPPLREEPRLRVPVSGAPDLQQALASNGYPLARAQSISLSGPRDAQAAMQALGESFCHVLLDAQFIDLAVSQQQRDWRIVLARPLLQGRLADAMSEGQALLELLNQARQQPRQCGGQAFAAAAALEWQAPLAEVAELHSRAMANQNFFAHQGRDGYTPGDRVELAGLTAGRVGENIAAGYARPAEVLAAWLASPTHCATLMDPDYRSLGAAYAVDPNSDAGIYWTALLSSP